jgi:hypothetical protein
MALPVLAKTWQFDVNQSVAAQGTALDTGERIMFTIKNSLLGFTTNPWICSGSSNSVAAALDGVDRIVTTANIVGAAGAHSWIVLRQTGIATNYEICIDWNSSGSNSISLVVSPSAGFTGGTTTARPTATDEMVIINQSAWFSNQDANHQVHVMQSTDGACTRIIVWRGGTNLCTFMLFDKPVNTVSGWTNPSISCAQSITGGSAISYSTLTAGTGSVGRGASQFTAQWAGESFGSLLLAELTNIGTVVNSFENAWSFFPIGAGSTTASNRGRHCSLADIWWKPTGISDADTFPNDADNRQFVAFGCLIFPWTNGTDVPLIT